MARTSRTITEVTDDLTGENIPEDNATDYPFTFGEVTGMVTLSPESFAKINAVPEFAALVKAAEAYESDEPARANGSRVLRTYAGDAYAWEVKTATAPHGLSVLSGGTVKTEAADKFAEFVTAGTWKVIGSKKRPDDDTEAAKLLAANLAATKPKK